MVIKVGLICWCHDSSEFGPLDFSSDHVLDQVSLVSHKAGMVNGSLVGPQVCYPRKPVQVQLSLKRGVLGLVEKVRHDFFHESPWLVDLEGFSVGLPANDRLAPRIVSSCGFYLHGF